MAANPACRISCCTFLSSIMSGAENDAWERPWLFFVVDGVPGAENEGTSVLRNPNPGAGTTVAKSESKTPDLRDMAIQGERS
jgi:hypothetical protein